MIRVNEVTDLMDQMLKVDIFHPTEKLRMLRDEEKTFLDPNLIMDARHRIHRENLSISPTKRSVLTEAKRLFTQEEEAQLYLKKQQRYLERELRRFETELKKSRPRFYKPYTCKRRSFAPSDDEDFWGTFRKTKRNTTSKENAERSCGFERTTDALLQRSTVTDADHFALTVENREDPKEVECEVPCVGSIKVTIKDKSNSETEMQSLYILRKCFDALKDNAEEEQRLRDIKTKIQQNVTMRLTKKYFDIWRTCIKSKTVNTRKQEDTEISDERKIEMFISAITDRQKELMKCRKPKARDGIVVAKDTNKTEMIRKNVYSQSVIVESPAQSRLNAQKRIIEEQRAKLAEQKRIIDELKLKEAQKEIYKAGKDTVDIAKETLTYCGKKTRRTLVQLMQQAGYRDESLTVPHRAPDPPKFLSRMEARAEARRERVRLAEELRRKKLEEQKQEEEAARIEEEQKKRRLQQEAVAEARRLRKEQEQNRLREIERFKKLNHIADKFYRKYLLRHYLMEPLIALIEEKKSNVKKADNQYRKSLTRKIFIMWKQETKTQYEVKVEIAESFHNRNLMVRAFREWKLMANEVNLSYQVATDFSDMKLLDKYFRLWQTITLELKAECKRKEKLVTCHYVNKLKFRYFFMWRKYLTIAADVIESEKRKNELRQLVQTVIPDFDPKQRGVALED